jgi:general secretion pathway protein D
MRSVVSLLALTWIVLWSLCSAPQPARAEPAPVTSAARSITMDFQDVDIAALVKSMSEVTGKNFILDERVHGKLTIISPTKMSVDEAYRAFQSALQLKGFTTVRVGAVIKIVPSKDAKSSTIDTVLPQ